MEEAPGAVEPDPARIDHVDPGVHEEGQVRRRREPRDREDLPGAQFVPYTLHGGDEVPRRAFELGTVGQEDGVRGLRRPDVGLARDDREVSDGVRGRHVEVGHRRRQALRRREIVGMADGLGSE